MSIVNNNLTTANTKFFKSFVPYQSPSNTTPTNNISDMISLNYIRGRPKSIINYDIGAASTYSMDLEIKNITLNTSLEISVITDMLFVPSEKSFVLEPGTTRVVFLRSNNSYIDEQSDNFIRDSNIKIIVKNITNKLTFIQNNVVRLQQRALPTEIMVK